MDTSSRTELFLELSSALCGVAIDSFRPASGSSPTIFPKLGDLMPRNTPIDRMTEFLETLDQNVGSETVNELLTSFSHLQKQGSPTLAAESLLGTESSAGICRSIMKMWFLGIWYSPADPFTPHHVISTQAYKESLIWKVMQSHPMGYSVWSHGYWSDEPPKITEFLTLSD